MERFLVATLHEMTKFNVFDWGMSMKYPCILLLIPVLLSLPWALPAVGQSVRAQDVFAPQHECSGPVESREEAARCFSVYFEARLELLRAQRGVMPSSVKELYQPVGEEDICVRRGGSYHISRDGYGSPYFISDGVIYLDLD